MENNQKQHIFRSNNLIECGYHLTLSEQRIITIASKKLKPVFVNKNISMDELRLLAKANLFEPIEISIPEYKKEFNIKSNNLYTELVKATDSLYQKDILYFNEDEGLTKKRWVITCTFNSKSKKVLIEFHPDLIMDLLIFKGKYTKLNYFFLTTVKNSYTSRLYEILRQYLNIGTRSILLEDLRFKLGLTDSMYQPYGSFKKKILTPAIEWINLNSDIQIIMEEDKLGTRKVKQLNFTIKPKVNTLPLADVAVQSDVLGSLNESSAYTKVKDIIDIDITAQELDIICDAAINGLKKHDLSDVKILDYITEKWEIVKKYSKNKKDFNVIGALVKALVSNWKYKQLESTKSFHNFKGRDYDWNALEDMLLGYEEYDSDKLYNK